MSNGPAPTADACPPLRYPAVLILSLLAAELAMLAWSAFPRQTMRAEQTLESWTYLAGLLALFAGVVWPISRRDRLTARQALLEAVLLAAAGGPAVVIAAVWCDASSGQVVSGAGYAMAWLTAGAVATTSANAVRWAWGLLAALANLGLLGLGYLRLEFLGADPLALWRWSPMVQAGQLAEGGWMTAPIEQVASAVPVGAFLLLLAIRLIPRPR